MAKADFTWKSLPTSAVVLLFMMALLLACNQSGSRSLPSLDRVVVDEHQILQDGAFVSWKVPPGRYRLEMTAADDGATAEWVGGDCPATQPMRQLTMTCELRGEGQLIIKNPTTFGLGASVSVTVKVTKLAF